MNTINWEAYKEWYWDTEPDAVFMFTEGEPVEIVDTDRKPDDGTYYLVAQSIFRAWIPARFVIESEVSE